MACDMCRELPTSYVLNAMGRILAMSMQKVQAARLASRGTAPALVLLAVAFLHGDRLADDLQ